MEDVDEDEEEEEVVVLGDAGCAVMRAGAGLWAAAASAAATAGGWRACPWAADWGRVAGGASRDMAARRTIWSSAVGEGGAGLRSPRSRLGWVGVLQCVRVCGLVSTGGNSTRGLPSRAGGGRPWVLVRAGGVCGSLRGVRKSHCRVFLGGLDPGQAPLETLLLMLRQT